MRIDSTPFQSLLKVTFLDFPFARTGSVRELLRESRRTDKGDAQTSQPWRLGVCRKQSALGPELRGNKTPNFFGHEWNQRQFVEE